MSIDLKEYAQLAAGVYTTTQRNVLESPSGGSINGTLIADQSDGFSAGVLKNGGGHKSWGLGFSVFS